MLVQLGEAREIVPHPLARALLAAGILSMFVTPLLVRLAPSVPGDRLL